MAINKYLQQGLLSSIILSLVACGGSGSSGNNKSSTPASTPASVAASSIAESSSSAVETSSSADTSSSEPTSATPSSDDASSSVGTSSSSSSSSVTPTPTLTGVFVDSVVAGIDYRTATKTGTTTALGEYEYLEGETVVFFIGDLELPAVPAKGVVTPADIAAAHSSDSTIAAITKTNILQLLQTLDKDGDPTNGIQITDTASSLFAGANVPDITTAEFDTAVASLLPQGTTLVSEVDALAHFDSTLQAQLLGSWMYSEGEGKRNVLTFIDDKTYLIIHEHDDEESQRAGSVEYGSYEWDLATSELRVQLIGQSDENGGLYSENSETAGVVTHTIAVDGTTLTLGTPSDGQAVFTRVRDNTNPFIGGWGMINANDAEKLHILTFLSATEYAIAHTKNESNYINESAQPLSGEFGSYTLTNNQFLVTGVTVDTDGDGGLYNRENENDQQNETMEITPWGDLLFGDDNEGSFSFARLGSFAANLQDYDSDHPLGTISITRYPGGFSENYIAGKHFSTEVPLADGSSTIFTFVFGDDFNDDDIASGTLVATGEDEEEPTIDINWTINSTGTVIVTFTNDNESFTMAIAKLVGNNSETESKILLSLESEEESSLWESSFKMIPLL